MKMKILKQKSWEPFKDRFFSESMMHFSNLPKHVPKTYLEMTLPEKNDLQEVSRKSTLGHVNKEWAICKISAIFSLVGQNWIKFCQLT